MDQQQQPTSQVDMPMSFAKTVSSSPKAAGILVKLLITLQKLQLESVDSKPWPHPVSTLMLVDKIQREFTLALEGMAGRMWRTPVLCSSQTLNSLLDMPPASINAESITFSNFTCNLENSIKSSELPPDG